ncbi:MAG: response regulator [Chloroflexi bacterium]|nr:response regulator [Chloroflexota bacterium]
MNKRPFLRPASLDHRDFEQQRQGRWLKIFLLSFTVALLIILIMLPSVPMRSNQVFTSIGIILILFIINAVSYGLVRRGHLQFAAWLVSLAALSAVTHTIFIFDGIRSSLVFGYFVVVSVVSLFLQGRAILLFFLLNVGALVIAYYAEQVGLLIAAPSEKAAIDDLVILLLALCLNTILLQLLLGNMADNTNEAREAIAALTQSNEELYKSQMMLQDARDLLEARVDQRTTELSSMNETLQLEIEARQKIQKSLHNREQRLQQQNVALLKLAQNQALGVGNIQATVREIAEATAVTLDVERASVWLYNEESGSFKCSTLFVHSLNEHQTVHYYSNYPAFKQAVAHNEIVSESELAASPFMLDETHISPQTTALVAAPIRVNGRPVGVVCCEHSGESRTWSLEDQQFLNSIANLMALAMESSERRRAEDALRHSQKVESLGVLAGGVAHDFNNLLVAILGQTSLTLAKLPEDHEVVNHITKAVNASKRAADLTRQLLAYSGHGKFEIQTINLNELIRENLHLFTVAVPKFIRLDSDLAEMVPLIDADPGQMQQVVMNLILNAADAIGMEKGTIFVCTQPRWISESETEVWQGMGMKLAAGHYVSLIVEDTGCGMDAETVSRIFDPFFTTKPTGRGLGLAAVMGIVRGHQGGVRVESEVDKGTKFHLIFPAGTAVTEHVDMMRLQPLEARNDMVLVIDDELAVREAVTDILEMNGLRVETAVDGETGVELYKTLQDQIALVLLDLSLPGMNGLEVFDILHELNPDVKVIISSGYSKEDIKRSLTKTGTIDFLQKPYTMQGLLEKMWEYLVVI